MKIEQPRPNKVMDNASVYAFPSSSRPGLVHFTVVGPKGAFCSCEAGQYRKMCKHIEKVPRWSGSQNSDAQSSSESS